MFVAIGVTIASYVLALGRALGETMAVTMLIGNTNLIPTGLTATGNTMASVIANQFGEKVEELNQTEEGVLVHSFDLTELEKVRTAWGVFRDRRPNLYWPLSTLDGETLSE